MAGQEDMTMDGANAVAAVKVEVFSVIGLATPDEAVEIAAALARVAVIYRRLVARYEDASAMDVTFHARSSTASGDAERAA